MRVGRRRKLLARTLTLLMGLAAAACEQAESSGPSPPPGPTAATYYVDNCVVVGSDSNNGTSSSAPWLTVQKVNTSTFNPGDSILFQSTCTWREQLTVPSSGSAGSPITFGAYGTGAQPILSGADLLTSWVSAPPWYYAPVAAQPNQVFRDDQRLTLAASQAALATGQWWWDATNSRVYVYDDPSGYTIEASQRNYAIYASSQNYITISGIEADKARVHGIYTYLSNNILVTGVAVQWNYYEGARLEYGSSVVISSSLAAYSGGSGVEINSTPGGLVDRVVSHDNCQLSTGGLSFLQNHTAGIKLGNPDQPAPNMTVQYSDVYDNGVGQSANVGIGIWADTVSPGFTAKYNLVHGNNMAGILAEASSQVSLLYNIVYGTGTQSGYPDTVGIWLWADNSSIPMTGSLIANNTSYGNQGEGIAIYAVNSSGGCVNNSVENNISTGNTADQLGAYGGCENPGTNGSGNVYTYNGFGAGARNFIQWGLGVYESTYTAWETATGNCGTTGCSHSVQADPQFVNASAAQFWLQSSSPAIDAGTNLGSPYDMGLLPGSSWPNSVLAGDQNSYGTGWEVGAYIFTGQTGSAATPRASL
jgi:hypothetical protein